MLDLWSQNRELIQVFMMLVIDSIIFLLFLTLMESGLARRFARSLSGSVQSSALMSAGGADDGKDVELDELMPPIVSSTRDFISTSPIVADELKKTYSGHGAPDVRACRGVSFKVNSGIVYGLLGCVFLILFMLFLVLATSLYPPRPRLLLPPIVLLLLPLHSPNRSCSAPTARERAR